MTRETQWQTQTHPHRRTHTGNAKAAEIEKRKKERGCLHQIHAAARILSDREIPVETHRADHATALVFPQKSRGDTDRRQAFLERGVRATAFGVPIVSVAPSRGKGQRSNRQVRR